MRRDRWSRDASVMSILLLAQDSIFKNNSWSSNYFPHRGMRWSWIKDIADRMKMANVIYTYRASCGKIY